MRTPWPHQRDMIAHLEANQNTALLVEMRLGKSHALISAFNNVDRVLVVCPKSVMAVWREELHRDRIGSVCLVTSSGLHDYRDTFRWTVMNYEAAMRIPEKYRERFDVVILDEAVRIKNPQAKVTKFFVTNFRNARRVVASGNIAPESPLEYFSPMKFVYGKWMGCANYWQFRKTYFSSDIQGWTWWPKNKDIRERIKSAVKSHSFILTRKQAGLANQKIYEKRYVELPKNVRALYKKMENEFALTLPSGKEIEVQHVVAQVSYLSQLCGGGTKDESLADHKIKELVELLTGELAKEQVVVWFRYNFEIGRVVMTLMKTKIKFDSLIGDSDIDERKSIQDQFTKGEIRVLLIQIKVGLYGLNLSKASTAIYFSNPLSSNERVQSEDRIEHNDKSEPLLYIDILSKDTIDEDIYAALKQKHRQSKFFIGEVMEQMRLRRAA